MLDTSFKEDRLVRIKDSTTEPTEIAATVVARLVAVIQESGGEFKGARAENGVCVMKAEIEEQEYVIICGADSTSRQLAVRVLTSDKFPAYVAIGAFVVAMVAILLISAITGFTSKQPLASFVGATAASIVVSYLCFMGANYFRGRKKADVGDVKMDYARSILVRFAEGIEGDEVEVVEERCRIIGIDVNPEAKNLADGPTVEMRSDTVVWTKVFQTAIGSVAVD